MSLSLQEKITNMKRRTFDLDCIPISLDGKCPNGVPGSDYEFCEASLQFAEKVRITGNDGSKINIIICPRCHSKVRPSFPRIRRL